MCEHQGLNKDQGREWTKERWREGKKEVKTIENENEWRRRDEYRGNDKTQNMRVRVCESHTLQALISLSNAAATLATLSFPFPHVWFLKSETLSRLASGPKISPQSPLLPYKHTDARAHTHTHTWIHTYFNCLCPVCDVIVLTGKLYVQK